MAQRPVFASSADESWGARSRKQADPDLDITPMIDVTFLLLIFFMVGSTMAPNEDRNVPTAEHGVGIDGKKAVIIRVLSSRGGPSAPEIRIDSTAIALEDLTRRIADQVASGFTDVIIKAERDVPYAVVQRVARAATATEGVKLSIGVQDSGNR